MMPSWMEKLGTPAEWIALLWTTGVFSVLVRFFMTKQGMLGPEQTIRNVAGILMYIAIPLAVIATYMYFRPKRRPS
jgi:hypothetical protein